jgi:hypothetical protein
MKLYIKRTTVFCAAILALLFCAGELQAQPVQVSGRCITGTINLTVDPGSPLNGKVWYSGTGTVLGFSGVAVNIYWNNTVNKWYLEFDGQPYFENADNTTLPPSTNIASWVPTVDNNNCLDGPALAITGTGTGDREINVKQNTTNIADGGSFNFGNVGTGANDNKTFTIENTGTITLNLTGTAPNYIIKGGTNPGDFTITQPASGVINAAGNTTFSVTFSPGGTGARSCTLQIPNNDGNENPYDITLTGNGTCPPITFVATTSNTCAGGSTGQIAVISITGGTAPYTYSKDGGANYQTNSTFTGLSAQTYQVVVKDNNGCTTGATGIPIGTNPLPAVYNVSGGGAYCAGGTGVTVGLSDSDAGVNYQLFRGATPVSTLPGDGNALSFGLQTTAGTYTVTATNASTGCQNNMSGSAVITVNPTPSCLISFNNPPPWGIDSTCANSTGNIYSGPAGMSSYNWSITGSGTITSGTSGASIEVTAGSYFPYSVFLTVTDANGCVSSCNDQTPIKPAPSCSLSGPTTVACNSGGHVYSVSNGPSFISSYNWSISGNGTITSATNGSSVTVTAGAGGSYTIQVTSNGFNACSSVCSQAVTINACNIDFSGKVIFTNNNTLGVKDATLTLSGSATGSDLSDSNGDYSIATTVGSGSFTLKPAKTANKLNGITTGDATAIQQHVANITLITDLYKLVAADVNKSNSITSVDASIINQALLGNPSALSQFSTSWRFVPTSHTMSNPPWTFPEQRTYTNINASQTGQDFYGIKTGDVVSTFANPASLVALPVLALRTAEQTAQSGQTLDVDFKADQFNNLAAFQMALSFDPAQLQFVEVQPTAALPLTADNVGLYNLAAGEIRVVWSQETGVAVGEAASLFRLRFNALQNNVKLSEALQLDEAILPALCYTSSLEETKVKLEFSGASTTGNPSVVHQFQLLQNRPNPFNGSTNIAFTLPEACEAQLRIFDVAGRLLAERKGQYPAGRSEERFELPAAAGMLYYELSTPFGVLSRKMMVAR